MFYTAEIFKKDGRRKEGKRLIAKIDYERMDEFQVIDSVNINYPADRGFTFEIFQTYVIKKNYMNGEKFEERYDTPYYCSPSSETYWSM